MIKSPSIHAIFLVEPIKRETLSGVRLVDSDQPFLWSLDHKECSRALYESIDQWIDTYLSGCAPSLTVPLTSILLPHFTQKVVDALSSISYGSTMTYREIAALCGNQNGARAVGNACGRNPWPLLIPCHRVVAMSGIGGFSSGGIVVKEKLLSFESQWHSSCSS